VTRRLLTRLGYSPVRLRSITWLLLISAASVMSAVAGANDVAASGAHHQSFPVTANDLKPPECAGITLYSVVTGSGDITGGNVNELILGSSGADIIYGKGGDDCILGGAGNDEIIGGLSNGIDILLGGSGDDTLNGQNGSLDVCYGGAGTDQFEKCETIYDP
jgi:Ca2+-binding RTX toxin-like protein